MFKMSKGVRCTPREDTMDAKYTKSLKVIGGLLTVVALAKTINVADVYLNQQWARFKRQFVASVIESDLSEKDLTIDIKTKSKRPLEKLSSDDLRKAIWVLKVQNEQLQYTVDTVKSALDYHQED